MKKFLKNNFSLIFLISVALILRLILINQSLWLDESIGAEAVRKFSYKEIITDFSKFDNHPPLYYLSLKFWTNIFGYSEFSLRSLSVLFGVLTIFMTYLVGLKLFTRHEYAFWPALLLATSQFHIYYSQEARMYSLAAFLTSVCVYFFLKISEKNSKLSSWIIFSLSTVALCFSDYMPLLLIPVFWIVPILLRKEKSWWFKYILSYLPLLILVFLWSPIFLIQSEKGRWLLQTMPSWHEVAGGATLKQVVLVWMKFVFGRISLRPKFVYYILTFLASIPYLISFLILLKNRKSIPLILVLWLVLPLFIGFVMSFFFPAFIYFRYLYLFPAFILISFLGISLIKRLNSQKILIGIILLFNLISWSLYVFDKNQQREDWRKATNFVESKLQDYEIVIFEYPEPFTPYRWYSKNRAKAFGALDSIYANYEPTSIKVQALISNVNGVYYFEYLRDLSDPKRIVEQVLKNQGFKVIEVFNFNGVGQVYFWKK